MRGPLLALAVVSAAALPASARSFVPGVRGEMRLDVHRVRAGAKPGEPLSSVVVRGHWTHEAFVATPDRRTLLLHRFDGLAIARAGSPASGTYAHRFPARELAVSPAGDRVAFWAGGSVATAPLERLGDGANRLRQEVLHEPVPGSFLSGFEWSPAGDALLVLDATRGEGGRPAGVLWHAVPGGEKRELLRHPAAVDFVALPTSRSRRGVSSSPYRIALAASDGLWLARQDGSEKQRLHECGSPLDQAEWSPGEKEKLVVLGTSPRLAGLVLFHLDRKGEKAVETLDAAKDVHTVWFSPGGKSIAWASERGVTVRAVEGGEPASVVPRVGGRPLPVKGLDWHDDEDRVAIAAGSSLFVYRVSRKELVEIAALGDSPRSFLGDPRFTGDDELLVTLYTDVGPVPAGAEKRR